MKNIKEIKALVSLLDDPDLNIYNQVKNQLLELGEVCIPILEKANFENHLDSVYKTRISNLTHEINLNEMVTSHKKWLQHPWCQNTLKLPNKKV